MMVKATEKETATCSENFPTEASLPNEDACVDNSKDLNIVLFPRGKQNNEALSKISETSPVADTKTDIVSTTDVEPVAAARLDELRLKNLEQYSEKYRLVLKVKNGLTVPEACREIGWKKSLRAAYDTCERFKKLGKEGLVDHRWVRKREAAVLTREVIDIILAWYYQRRAAAGPRAIWKLTCQTYLERGLRQPAETTVKNYLYSLTAGEKLARRVANILTYMLRSRVSAQPALETENSRA